MKPAQQGSDRGSRISRSHLGSCGHNCAEQAAHGSILEVGVPALEGGAVGSWLNLVPGQIGIILHPDDSVDHERLLLWRHSEGLWMILTRDGDRYVEDLRCAGGDGPTRMRVKGIDFKYWSRAEGPVYRFRDYPTNIFLFISTADSSSVIVSISR